MRRKLFALVPLMVVSFSWAGITNFINDNSKNLVLTHSHAINNNDKDKINPYANVAFVETRNTNNNGVVTLADINYSAKNTPLCEPVLDINHNIINNEVCLGTDVEITVTADTGAGTTYQWSVTGPTIRIGTQATLSFTPQEGTYTYRVIGEHNGCFSNEEILTFEVKAKTTPTFANVPTSICMGDDSHTLPAISDEGITGTWQPATIDATTGGLYVFTPTTGECATPREIYIDIDQKRTPLFLPIDSMICPGGSVDLPTTSFNGITGSWSPAFDNTQTTEYTFTPDPDQCAIEVKITITVSAYIIPTFSSIDVPTSVCFGNGLVLPNVSAENIVGSWSPAFILPTETQTKEYTFTPADGQCAGEVKVTIAIATGGVTPTFPNIETSVCQGNIYLLPTTSAEGIKGKWSPVFVDPTETQTKEYTFTPDDGQCADEVKVTIAIATGGVTPTFSGIPASVCYGGSSPLPFISNEGIAGSWSPAFNSTQTTEYTFTPVDGQCADQVKVTIVVVPSGTIPTFASIPASICIGDDSHTLPTTSDEGIAGTWQPATIDSTQPGIYIFTPTLQGCGVTQKQISIEIKPTKTSGFVPIADLCLNSTPPALPTSSINTPAIQGSWSPAVIDTSVLGTTNYIFTPDAGQCGTSYTMPITITDGIITPTFTQIAPLCEGMQIPFVNTSNNSTPITGSWSPQVALAGIHTYTFTPDAGQCATTTTMEIEGTPGVVPSFDQIAPLCEGVSYSLPVQSNEGYKGSWSPSTILTTQGTHVYTFIPDDSCVATGVTFEVTVNDCGCPTLYFDTEAQDLIVECDGNDNISDLQDWLNNNGGAEIMGGIPLTWSNNYVDLYQNDCKKSATVTFLGTDSCGNFIQTTATFTIEDTTQPTFVGNLPQDMRILDCDELDDVPVLVATDNCDSDVDINFKEIKEGSNPTNYRLLRTWTATDSCGNQTSHTQILNVFCTPKVEIYNGISANMDGVNDIFYIKGIEKYEDNVVWIFNRWGVEVYKESGYDNKTKYWDGTSNGRATYNKGKKAPEGTYYYIIEYTNYENKRVKQTGYIYLTR